MTTPSHETLREQLLDLAYGELGRGEARALEKHLEGCAECRAELQRMTQTRTAMSALGQEPAPERGEAILLAAAREAARAAERQRRPFLPSWVWGASLGAVGLVVLGVVSFQLVGRLSGPGTPPRVDAQVASAPVPEPAPLAKEPAPAEAAQPRSDSASSEERSRSAATREESREAVAMAPKPAPGAPAAARPEPPRRAAKAKGEALLGRRDEERADAEAAPGAARGSAHGDLERKKASGGGAAAPAPAEKLAMREQQRAASDDRFAHPPPAASAPAVAPPAASAAAAAPPPARAAARERSAATGSPSAAQDAARPASPPPGADEPAVESERGLAAATGDRRAAAANVAAPEDAIARHARLRAAGRLRTATRAFAGCPGEAERAVELDGQGAVVKVTRRGTHQAKPYELELFYDEGGRLAAARWSSEGRVREVRAAPGAALAAAGIPPAALQPERAADAGLDAPPRCAR